MNLNVKKIKVIKGRKDACEILCKASLQTNIGMMAVQRQGDAKIRKSKLENEGKPVHHITVNEIIVKYQKNKI